MNHGSITCTATDGVELVGNCWEPEGDVRAVLCLIHGLGEHTGRYAHVAAALTASGYAVCGYDLRGHGKSGGPRGHTPTYDALMDDIGCLLDAAVARYPGKPRFLYGHSLGGGLVLNYALRRRPDVAGVMASSPWLRLGFPPPAPKVFLGRLMDHIWPAFLQPNGLDISALAHDPQVIRDYKADPLVHDKISARLGVTMLDAGEWALQHAAEFPVPLFLFHGGADPLTSPLGSAEFARRAGVTCTYREWEGLYHETHNEPQKQEVLATMIAWLDEHTVA